MILTQEHNDQQLLAPCCVYCMGSGHLSRAVVTVCCRPVSADSATYITLRTVIENHINPLQESIWRQVFFFVINLSCMRCYECWQLSVYLEVFDLYLFIFSMMLHLLYTTNASARNVFCVQGNCSMSSRSTGYVQVARVRTWLHGTNNASTHRSLRLSIRHIRKTLLHWAIACQYISIDIILMIQVLRVQMSWVVYCRMWHGKLPWHWTYQKMTKAKQLIISIIIIFYSRLAYCIHVESVESVK